MNARPEGQNWAEVKYEEVVDNRPNVWHYGEVLQEINIRLAGFGGNVPDEDFTERTEKTVKQFQKDYMKIEPTGVVDYKTLEAIDEFGEKYNFTFNQVKCKCGTCAGFGDGSNKGKDNYERPGLHRTILFSLKTLLFYFDDKKSKYSLNKISSGYRCRFHSIYIRTKTTNHMGRALDLHFNKDGKRTRDVVDTEAIRKDYFCDLMGAPYEDGGQTHKFGWKKNNFGLEPKKFNSGSVGATSWIHADVREFDAKYQEGKFFVKNQNDVIGDKLINLT